MTQKEINLQILKDAMRNLTNKNSLKLSGLVKAPEAVSLTALSPFHATLKVSARLSVLKPCGITKTILHDMGMAELTTLYNTLVHDTSVVGKEIVRRQSHGKKT